MTANITGLTVAGSPTAARACAAAAAAPAPPLIEVDGLTVSFPAPGGGRKTVVDNVSFTIPRGTVLGLVGESGSGKSVTSRSLVGLAGAGSQVSARTLRMAGHDVLELTEKQWRRIRGRDIAFVLQDALASLDTLRRVGSEVAEPMRLHQELKRAELEQAVLQLLAEAGIPDPASRVRQYPYELSGGLRQRALIASAIANRPSVLVADEPTTALDATVAAQILRLLGSLVGDDGALLMISHDLAAVASVADQIAVMRAGRVVEAGTVDQVLQDPQHDYTRQLLAAVPGAASRGQRLSGGHAPPRPAVQAEAGRAQQRPGQNLHPLLEVRSISKSYSGRTVLEDVSFSLGRGETLGIVGESGSGKTTAARIALGMEQPDSGEVLVGGLAWDAVARRQRAEVRREVQLISQDPLASFDPRYTVAKVLAEALAATGIRGSAALKRSGELLELVQLPAATLRARPLELSGGQRQRVAIARAIAVRPAVIVADEPVSALDVSVQAQILDLFADVQADTGVSYLFISHDLGVIYHVADRIVVLSEGHVVEEGDVETVFASPQHRYTRELMGAIPSLDNRRIGRTEKSA